MSTIRAADFLGTLGVNTHIDFNNYGYQNLAQVEANITYLGVTNLRDSPQSASDVQTWLQVSQATGAKFDAYIPEGSPTDMQNALNLIPQLAQAGVLNYIEGGNEEDDAYAASLGNTLQTTAQFQQQVYAMGQQLGLPVINMSFGSGWTAANNWQGDYGAVGDLTAYANYGNAHTYPGLNQTTDWSMQRLDGLAKMADSTDPVITTEIGWNESQGFTQTDVATRVLQAAMDGIKDGSPQTYFYSLYDDGSGLFGLMNQDGTPKPAGTALHNLTTLLADTDPNAHSFTTDTLSYTLSGTTANDFTLDFEKADGSHWVSLWNETDATHNVTLSLPNATEIKVFDPLNGTTATQDVTGNTVTLGVGASPQLVEISPTFIYDPNDLTVNVPSSQTVAANTTTAVPGVSISDAWAAQNPGTLALNLSDLNGTLHIAGQSGSSLQVLDTLANLNTALAGMTYSSGGAGSDTITVDVWNQAGVENTQSFTMTVH